MNKTHYQRRVQQWAVGTLVGCWKNTFLDRIHGILQDGCETRVGGFVVGHGCTRIKSDAGRKGNNRPEYLTFKSPIR